MQKYTLDNTLRNLLKEALLNEKLGNSHLSTTNRGKMKPLEHFATHTEGGFGNKYGYHTAMRDNNRYYKNDENASQGGGGNSDLRRQANNIDLGNAIQDGYRRNEEARNTAGNTQNTSLPQVINDIQDTYVKNLCSQVYNSLNDKYGDNKLKALNDEQIKNQCNFFLNKKNNQSIFTDFQKNAQVLSVLKKLRDKQAKEYLETVKKDKTISSEEKNEIYNKYSKVSNTVENWVENQKSYFFRKLDSTQTGKRMHQKLSDYKTLFTALGIGGVALLIFLWSVYIYVKDIFGQSEEINGAIRLKSVIETYNDSDTNNSNYVRDSTIQNNFRKKFHETNIEPQVIDSVINRMHLNNAPLDSLLNNKNFFNELKNEVDKEQNPMMSSLSKLQLQISNGYFDKQIITAINNPQAILNNPQYMNALKGKNVAPLLQQMGFDSQTIKEVQKYC